MSLRESARIWVAAPIALLISAAGCANPSAPPAESSGPCLVGEGLGEALSAIRTGALDDGDPAVVAVNTLDVSCMRAGTPACTGTLIAPDTVLTAAHCVGGVGGYPPSNFAVLFGSLADEGQGPLGSGLEGALFRVTQIRVHPAFDPASLSLDLALLRLERPASVPPLERRTTPLDASIVGQAASVVGFGRADTGPPTEKRRGAVALKALSAGDVTYGPDPAMTCDGDSGGPLLMKMENTEVLIGVTSRGDAACADHGVATRLDAAPPSFFDAPW